MSHPHDYLPTELWELIAKYLKDPADKCSLSDASPYFFQILERQRPQFLLEAILPILADLPRNHFLDQKDLLNFRLVNRGCNQAVLYYIQEYRRKKGPFIDERISRRYQYSLEDLPYRGHGLWNIRSPIYVARQTLPDIRNWLEYAELTHPPNSEANPIFSREAEIWIFGSEDEDEFFEEVLSTTTRLLESYGRHIHHCTFHFEHDSSPLESQYTWLKDWLSLVPNLKGLQIIYPISHSPVSVPPQLEEYIEAQRLPQLRHLSKLKAIDLPYPFQKEFFRQYGHAEIFHLRLSRWDYQRFSPVNLENITTLKVEMSSPFELGSLNRCLTPSWLQLQTLEMDFEGWLTCSRTTNCDNWKTVIGSFNRMFGQADRLVNLLLRMPSWSGGEDNRILENTRKYRLNLRHVQQLKLFVRNPFLLDFILPMKNSLKKLSVYNSPYISAHSENGLPPNEVVKLRGKIAWNGWFGSALLKSNISTTFRRLNFIRYERRKTLTYRKLMGIPVYINPDGVEEAHLEYEENVSEDELEGNGKGDDDSSDEECCI